MALDDLLDDIGVDATRWFLLQRSHETTIDLDLELARRQSQDNPVYYAQYAHARIASILRKAGEDRVARAPWPPTWPPAANSSIRPRGRWSSAWRRSRARCRTPPTGARPTG